MTTAEARELPRFKDIVRDVALCDPCVQREGDNTSTCKFCDVEFDTEHGSDCIYRRACEALGIPINRVQHA